MQEHLSKISRETEIQTKNQKKMLVTESTETKLKNVLDEFINRLNTAEERISELREKSTENSKTEMQRGKKKKAMKKKRISKNYETITKGVPCT